MPTTLALSPRRLARTLAVCAGALLLAGTAMATTPDENDPDFNRGGRTGFQFLKIGLGARQAALGEAAVATVDDASAVYWNPAGLTNVENYSASLSYTRWLADMNYSGAAVAGRVGNLGTVAVAVAALDYGDIPEAVVGEGPDGRTGDTFSGSDLMIGVNYAREFTEQLSIGIGAKYVHESLFDQGAGTFAFDVGTQYKVGYRGLTLAMAAQNLGGTARWLEEGASDRQEGYDLPLVFRLGVSGNLLGEDAFVGLGGSSRLVGSVEALHTNDYSERVHAGLEYVFNDILALRGGYRLNYEEGTWSVGAGVMPRIGGMQMHLDYAYVGYEFLDAPHRFSVSFDY
jgi:hypothetical protein